MIKHISLSLLFLVHIFIIILGEHTIRIQRNYDKLVHDMASTAHLIDQLVSDGILNPDDSVEIMPNIVPSEMNKGNNKITELRTILQRESQNS